MKNKIIIGLLCVTALSGFAISDKVYAASNNGANSLNKAPNDNEQAIELTDNTFLFGKGSFKVVYGDKTTEQINPNTTDLKVTTVKQAKEDSIAKTLSPTKIDRNSVFASMKIGNRPRVSGTNIELGYTQGASEVMSGTGWRYASYWYYPSSGTGDYLWWEARGDSGISPSPWDNSTTPTQGTALYPGAGQYLKGPFSQNKMTFASYSPASGSSYYVINQ